MFVDNLITWIIRCSDRHRSLCACFFLIFVTLCVYSLQSVNVAARDNEHNPLISWITLLSAHRCHIKNIAYYVEQVTQIVLIIYPRLLCSSLFFYVLKKNAIERTKWSIIHYNSVDVEWWELFSGHTNSWHTHTISIKTLLLQKEKSCASIKELTLPLLGIHTSFFGTAFQSREFPFDFENTQCSNTHTHTRGSHVAHLKFSSNSFSSQSYMNMNAHKLVKLKAV